MQFQYRYPVQQRRDYNPIQAMGVPHAETLHGKFVDHELRRIEEAQEYRSGILKLVRKVDKDFFWINQDLLEALDDPEMETALSSIYEFIKKQTKKLKRNWYKSKDKSRNEFIKNVAQEIQMFKQACDALREQSDSDSDSESKIMVVPPILPEQDQEPPPIPAELKLADSKGEEDSVLSVLSGEENEGEESKNTPMILDPRPAHLPTDVFVGPYNQASLGSPECDRPPAQIRRLASYEVADFEKSQALILLIIAFFGLGLLFKFMLSRINKPALHVELQQYFYPEIKIIQ